MKSIFMFGLIFSVSIAQAGVFGADDPVEALQEYYEEAKVEAQQQQELNAEQRAEYERELRKLERQKAQLERATKRYEAAVTAVQTEISTNEEKVRGLRTSIAEQRTQRSELAKTLRETRRQQLVEQKTTLATAQTEQIAKDTTQLQLLDRQVEKIEKECETFLASGPGWFRRLNSVCDDAEEMKSRRAKLDQKIKDLTGKRDQNQEAAQRLSDANYNGVIKLTDKQKEQLDAVDAQLNQNGQALRDAQASLTEAQKTREENQKELDAAKAEMTTVVGSIGATTESLDKNKTSNAQIAKDMALQKMKVALDSVINGGENKALRADFMFANLSDLTGSFGDGVLTNEEKLNEIKAQIMDKMDNTPLGMYVAEKIAQANKSGSGAGSNICTEIASCQMFGLSAATLEQNLKIEGNPDGDSGARTPGGTALGEK